MHSKNAKREFEKRLKTLGKALGALHAQEGIDAMLAFYEEIRADDCDLDADGDMLLFQWGTYKWSQAEPARFTVDLTRQLIPTGGDDEDIWQLSLTFAFEPELETSADRSNKWCGHPSGLAGFADFVNQSKVMSVVRERKPLSVELTYDHV